MREAVYQRARAALARQLTAVDPPLSTREIEAQHQELEDAVARLEAEFAPQEIPEPDFGDLSPQKDEFLYAAPTPPPAPQQPTRRPPPPAPMPTAAAPPPPDYEEDEEEEDDFDEEEDERGSRLPALIGLVLVALVVIGLGAFAFAERDTLLGMVGLGGGSAQTATTETAAPAPVVTPAPGGGTDEMDKSGDRLTNGAEAPPPSTPLPADSTASDSASLPVEGTTPPVPLPSESDSGLQNEQTAALQQGSDGLVGQRAIYYYQGAEGEQGQASDGTVTWSQITKDGRPAIQAIVHINDRKVTVSVTIYKNYDSSLPASHLVEIQFNGELSDSSIQRVPALVLKQTEQARGQPLVGAAVPVTNDLFWIALSDESDQVSRNIQLLREGSWFDVPILFNDQTRALITFEKGIPGDKVFETVMAGWTPPGGGG